MGIAGQIGADVKIAKATFLNFDVKYITIGSDVLAGSVPVSAVKINPILASVGIGYRF